MRAVAVDPAVLAAAFAAAAVFAAAAAAVGAAAFVERDAALGADGQGTECRSVYAQWESVQMFLAGQSAFDL